MKNKDFSNYLKKISTNIDYIYNAFYLWKSIQNKKYNVVYNQYKYFWVITFLSLHLYWILAIPRLFEESKPGKEKLFLFLFFFYYLPTMI